MLPTEEASTLHIEEDNKLMFYEESRVYSNTKSQHLYILSDEKIEENDWYWDNSAGNNRILQLEKGWSGKELLNNPFVKKVIATTDKTLGLQVPKGNVAMGWRWLPQINEAFIKSYVESYNQGKLITEVLVEYEYEDDIYIKLKLREDNTIIISQSKTYTRDEVIVILNKYYMDCIYDPTPEGNQRESSIKLKEWINKQLNI